MRDDRTARLLQLLSIAGQAGGSLFPGGRPGLLRWLGQLLDAHPGAAGYDQVEAFLQHRLAELTSRN
ncbi:hypothetical protein N7668_23610 [Pseudomonas fulva]|uniref:hypothetical protein n=1 Tax=Pseudomonas fulva TaxID=47880 RepID=UPI002446C61E|nr:hypothetical protein [Pseudomonas fulva]MDH0574222.1 hypothetical protein [Pseudomonas fulva]